MIQLKFEQSKKPKLDEDSNGETECNINDSSVADNASIEDNQSEDQTVSMSVGKPENPDGDGGDDHSESQQ